MPIRPRSALTGASGRSYPYDGSNCRHSFDRLEGANNVSTCTASSIPAARPCVSSRRWKLRIVVSSGIASNPLRRAKKIALKQSRARLPPCPKRSMHATAATGGCAASPPSQTVAGPIDPSAGIGAQYGPAALSTAPSLPSRPERPHNGSAYACPGPRRHQKSATWISAQHELPLSLRLPVSGRYCRTIVQRILVDGTIP